MGGVQACNFEKRNFSLGIKGEGQDTSGHFADGFGSMRAMLPMLGLGAKIGHETKI